MKGLNRFDGWLAAYYISMAGYFDMICIFARTFDRSASNLSHTQRTVCVRDAEAREGVNFINVLRDAFMSADPKSTKRQSSHLYLFALLGSLFVKVACIILVKFTQGGNPIK